MCIYFVMCNYFKALKGVCSGTEDMLMMQDNRTFLDDIMGLILFALDDDVGSATVNINQEEIDAERQSMMKFSDGERHRLFWRVGPLKQSKN